MAEKAPAPKTLYVNPDTFIPDGLKFVERKERVAWTETSTDETIDEIIDGGEIIVEEPEEPTGNSLAVPSDIKVITYTVRTGIDGNSVVDVVVEVPDVLGATDYEFKMTKI